MGKYATRKTLKRLLSCAGITLYKHRLDGVSYQYCAGGYVVNGYDTNTKPHDLLYEMQKVLIFLLKYGDKEVRCDDVRISYHKDRCVVEPLSKPLKSHSGSNVYTYGTPESDDYLEKFLKAMSKC